MTLRQREWLPVAFLGAALFLTACAVGPAFHVPAPLAVATLTKQPLPNATEAAPITGGEAQRFVPGADIPEEWWRSFHSDALNALIDESLRTNPDLKSVQAALRVAMENVRAHIGAYYPQISTGFSATRAKDAQQLSPVLASPILLYNL